MYIDVNISDGKKYGLCDSNCFIKGDTAILSRYVDHSSTSGEGARSIVSSLGGCWPAWQGWGVGVIRRNRPSSMICCGPSYKVGQTVGTGVGKVFCGARLVVVFLNPPKLKA